MLPAIKVVIQGGIGNQLFQVAWAKYINEKGIHAQVYLGLHQAQQQHGGLLYISLMGGSHSFVPISTQGKSPLISSPTIMGRIFRFVMRLLTLRHMPNYCLYDYDAMTEFSHCVKHAASPIHIGYFQFVNAAIEVRDSLFDEIWRWNSSVLSMKKETYGDMVAVHIRRGDFVNSKNTLHVSTGLEYIRQAMKLFPSRRFIVFSDDIRWCKENFYGWPNVFFSEEKSAIDDFLAIVCCSDYILSGSTFGWWAACIGSARGKTPRIVALDHGALFMRKESLLRVSPYVEVLAK